MNTMQQQLMLEKKMFDDGVTAWAAAQARNVERGNASDASWNRRLTKALVMPLAEGIDVIQEALKGKRGRRSKGNYIMQLIDSKVASYIAIKTLLDYAGNARYADELAVRKVATAIGERIEDNIRFTKLEEAAPNYFKTVQETLAKAFSHKYSHQVNALAAAERRLVAAAKEGKSEYAIPLDSWVHWSDDDKVQVGMFMLDAMQRVCTLNDAPIINVIDGKQSSRADKTAPKCVQLSDEVTKWCQEYAEEVGKMFPHFAPCVVPPRPWVAPFDGGYYTPEIASRLPLIKSGSFKHRKSLTKEVMPKVYKAVNYLQSVAWQVNTELMQAADMLFKSGVHDKKHLPKRDPAEFPNSPIKGHGLDDLHGKQLLAVLSKEDGDRFMKWKAAVRDLHTAERTRKAKVQKFQSVLAQAKEYSIYPNIYFVWNLDSRSRVYCNSSRLSPQGEDIGKAMIRLSHGVRLGEHGRKWLAVHGMGVWAESVPNSDKKGDKISIEKRVEAVDMMQEEILDCAANPQYFKFWLGADKPWQFLAWCQEWARLIEWEQQGYSTEDFISHIPVALDGSCSGIQHYSAMLRDEVGGKYVNLTCETEQQDIYGEVARRCIERLNEQKMGENKRMAEDWLAFEIDRGFCKKPVMTLPYGSSMLTSRENIIQKLADRTAKVKDACEKAGVPYTKAHAFVNDDASNKEYSLEAIRFMNSIMWKEIGDTVPAARAAMKFIKAVTHKVAKAGHKMRWTTPIGFIVEQSIFESEDYYIKTPLLGGTTLLMGTKTDVIDVNAMKGAAAPNFVHSYDASHLMAVCNAAEDNGIKGLACIHDSFGATAGETELLSRLLRETFIAMYDGFDPLESFLQEQEEIIGEAIEVEMPERGNLDIKQMIHSQYCFI